MPYPSYYMPPPHYYPGYPPPPGAVMGTPAYDNVHSTTSSSQVSNPQAYSASRPYIMEPIDDFDPKLESYQLPLPSLVQIELTDGTINPFHVQQLLAMHHFLNVFAKSLICWTGIIPPLGIYL
jgi:hypothetical protein